MTIHKFSPPGASTHVQQSLVARIKADPGECIQRALPYMVKVGKQHGDDEARRFLQAWAQGDTSQWPDYERGEPIALSVAEKLHGLAMIAKGRRNDD